MTPVQSQRRRRFLSRLGRGDDLVQGIVDLCTSAQVRSGELRAWGFLEDVELQLYDPKNGILRGRTLGGAVQLLQLTGSVTDLAGSLGVLAHVLVAREGEAGPEVQGGLLVRARVLSAEVLVDSFDDLVLRRGADPDTGLPTWLGVEALSDSRAPAQPAGRPAASPAPPPKPEQRPQAKSAPGWESVVTVSARKQQEAPEPPEPPEQPPPRRGDLIDHPTFGRCTVEKVDDDVDRVHIRLRNGRLVQLSLEVFPLALAGHEGAARLYQKGVKRR